MTRINRSAGVASALAWLAWLAFADPLHAQPWIARHGLSPAQYQSTFDDLAQQGYRLVSVSGYVSGGTERYAAHWEKTSGPAWVSRHGLSAAGYQSAFDDYRQQGYRLKWVSGYEVGGQERYAAIWEKTSGPAWVARHGLTAAQYQQAFDDYTHQGYRLRHVSGYSRAGSARYAAIFDKSSGPEWVARHGLSSAQYQQAFDTFNQQGYRLKVVSGYRVGGADHYAALWEKSDGPAWGARHGVPDAWYQNVFDNYYYQGYRPTFISAFTSGSAGKLNGVWENSSFSGSDLQTIASKIQAYLSTYQAPAVAVAVTKDGRLVYAAGFGQADQTTGEEAGPTSLFRIASVSKPFTSVAVMKLIEANQLSLEDKIFGPGTVLGSSYPTPANNLKIEKITVRHLLSHVSGLSNTPNDPMFQNTALNHQQLIQWVLNDPARALSREPGAQYEYCNFGYCLLGRIIEKKTGQSYEAHLQQSVLTPCGITHMAVAGNSPAERQPREVVYYPSSAYSLNVRRFDSHGGWVASSIDLVRFLVRVDGRPAPPDIISAASQTAMTTKAGIKDGSNNDPNYAFGWVVSPQWHNGAMSGTVAVLAVAANGFTFAAVVNTRPANDGFAGNLSSMMQNVINSVSSWPAHDLF